MGERHTHSFLKLCIRAKTLVLFFCLSFASVAFAQQNITVKGNVKDASGESVIGASIKCGATGTISDLDGNFTLNVPPDATIQVTYLGYLTQNIPVNNRTNLTIVMTEDAKNLEEVVIVGYGSQRVKDLTGSAVAVNMDNIIQTPGTSIIDALSGQVVGLGVTQSDGRPGSVGSLRVRVPANFDGVGSIELKPLVVIDDVVQVNENGYPDMEAFNRLDYSEIESFTVLKDASAAIYGSRSANGVILVKTKRGTAGKPKIDYSVKLDFQDAVGHIKVMDAYQTGVFNNRLIYQEYLNSLNTSTGIYSDDHREYMYSADELNTMKNLNHDWLGEAWQPAVSQRHSVTVTGGSQTVTYFAGLNYQDQDNNLGKVQAYDRWTFRAGGDIKVAAGLKLSASVNGWNSQKTAPHDQAKINAGPWGNSNSSPDDYLQLRHLPKYIPWQVNMLDPVSNRMKDIYISPWTGPRDNKPLDDGNLGSGMYAWNFFANEASMARDFSDGNGYDANFSLTYDVPFIKGLSLKGIYAVNYSNSGTNNQGGYYQIAHPNNMDQTGMHLIGDYTEYTLLNYGDPEGTDLSKKPTVEYSKSVQKSEQMNFWLTYARTFGKHDILATGVIERNEASGSKIQVSYLGLPLTYLGQGNTAGTLNTDNGRTLFEKQESGALSYAGRLNYKFDDRYLFEFLIRTEASTKFAPENYWGVFPSASVGWILSEEKFFQNSQLAHIFDFLKFRYSLGKTGQDNIAAWTWLQSYVANTNGGYGFGPLGGQPSLGTNLSGTANRNIKWDTSIKHNIGVDMNVIDNRLSLTAEYWNSRSYDLLFLYADPEEPIYLGMQVPVSNYGKKNSWGLEFALRWNDEIQQGWMPSWGPIRYGIGMDYSISWNKTVLGQTAPFDYPATMIGSGGAPNTTGWRSPGYEYGFRTWKHTSGGDGILRTQADIDNYWQYLTDLATVNGSTPQYLDILNKSDMKPGMIAYEDVAGTIDVENRTIAGPNGVISYDHGQDYIPLVSKLTHAIPTKLSLRWGNFSWQANLQASWGGLAMIDQNAIQKYGEEDMMWAQFSYLTDMFDPVDNPDGKYPSQQSVKRNDPSDFWMVPSFRLYVRNMTFAYSLPKQWLQKTRLGIDGLQINLTGNNLWDFYNPYPDHYRNMYDDGRTGYPTLRTWTLGANLSF